MIFNLKVWCILLSPWGNASRPSSRSRFALITKKSHINKYAAQTQLHRVINTAKMTSARGHRTRSSYVHSRVAYLCGLKHSDLSSRVFFCGSWVYITFHLEKRGLADWLSLKNKHQTGQKLSSSGPEKPNKLVPASPQSIGRDASCSLRWTYTLLLDPPPKSDVQRGWPVQMLITLLCPHLFVFHPSLRPLCQFMSFWRINFSTSVGKFCWSNAIKDWTTQWIIQQSELTLPSHLDINHMPSHHPATHPQERSGFNKNSKNLKTNVK